jgi:hypothetical protein
MNDSDNKDTFSNTPNEDWTENNKTNSLSDTSNVENSEIVEESSMPLEKEEITESQEETEEIMDIDNIVEQIENEILEEALKYEINAESETLETDILEIEKEEVNQESGEEKYTAEDLEEDLSTEEEEKIIEEANFIEEEISTESNGELESNDFVEDAEEILNGTQNDMLASLENIEVEIEESSVITEQEVIDFEREVTTNFDELENKKNEEVFVETSAFIHEDDNEEDMLKKTSFLFAILGGLGAILVSSLFWAETALLLDKYYNYDHKYAYMALFVGLCVGLGIRWAGRGTTYGYGILAVIFTLGGSLSGTLLSTLVHVVEAFGVSYFEILDVFDFTFLYGLLEDRFQYLDIAFYISAVILAYWISIRKRDK